MHQHGGNSNNGGEITLWDKRTHGHQGNLKIQLQHVGGEYYALRYSHSGKCVHVHGGATGNDTPITQWDYVDQANLKWRFIPIYGGWEVFNGGRFFLQSALGPVAHVHGGQASNGAKVSVWDHRTHGHQANLQWTLADAGNGEYYIQSAIDPSFVMHQHGGNSNNGGEITLWDRRTHGHQGNLKVKFLPAGGDLWAVQFVHSGKCVHVHGGGTANDTAITQWDYVDQPNLKWRFVPIH